MFCCKPAIWEPCLRNDAAATIEGKTLAQLVDALDADAWNYLHMHGDAVDVKIPSFETEYFVSLKDILPKMGIKQAFSSRADFSALSSTPNLCIGDVLHKSKIKVDEEGSEAAAVTDIILMEGASAPENSPTYLEFHANHPFLYLFY